MRAGPSAGAQGNEVGPWVWSPESHSRGSFRTRLCPKTAWHSLPGGSPLDGSRGTESERLDFGEFTRLGSPVSQRHPGPKASCSLDLRFQPERAGNSQGL